MTEPEDDKYSETIDNLSQVHYPQTKESIRYILSLATGSLIFSITFIEKIAPTPTHRLLIVYGWIFLLVSIIAGIWTIGVMYNFITNLKTLKQISSDEAMKNIMFNKGYLERRLVRKFIDNKMFQEEMQKRGVTIPDGEVESHIERILNDETTLNKLIDIVSTPADDTPETKRQAKMAKAALRFYKMCQRIVPYAHPTRVMNRIRRQMLAMLILPAITYMAFYAGILLITIFAIKNFG